MQSHATDVLKLLKQRLDTLYLIVGEEPLLMMEARNQICAEAAKQDYIVAERIFIGAQFEWSILLDKIQNLNLFGDKRLIDCRLLDGKIDKSGIEALIQISEKLVPDTIFVFSFENFNRKTYETTWFQTLEKRGIKILAGILTGSQKMHWLKKRLSENGFEVDPQDNKCLQFILDHSQGNLFATEQIIQKLKWYFTKPPNALPPIQLNIEMLANPDIFQLIGNDSRYVLFDLVDAALAGDSMKTIRIFSCLKSEGFDPVLLLWAFTQEVSKIISIAYALKTGQSRETIFREQGVWQNKKPLYNAILSRSNLDHLKMLLLKAAEIDTVIKGHFGSSFAFHSVINKPMDALFLLYLELSGVNCMREFNLHTAEVH